jgi:hypothetical protein
MRDGLDERHGLAAGGAQGRSRAVGGHAAQIAQSARGALIFIKVSGR